MSGKVSCPGYVDEFLRVVCDCACSGTTRIGSPSLPESSLPVPMRPRRLHRACWALSCELHWGGGRR